MGLKVDEVAKEFYCLASAPCSVYLIVKVGNKSDAIVAVVGVRLNIAVADGGDVVHAKEFVQGRSYKGLGGSARQVAYDYRGGRHHSWFVQVPRCSGDVGDSDLLLQDVQWVR